MLSDSNHKCCPTPSKWEKVHKIIGFMKVFYEITYFMELSIPLLIYIFFIYCYGILNFERKFGRTGIYSCKEQQNKCLEIWKVLVLVQLGLSNDNHIRPSL